jgi:hypothetical protein
MALINVFGNIALNDTVQMLKRLLKIAEPLGNVDAANRQRVAVDVLTPGMILSTVTTVTGVTNLATIAGLDQRQFHDGARVAYNTGVRRNLNFS